VSIGLGTWREREGLLVLLIALHSYCVGLMLMFASAFALRLGGWGDEGQLFFTRQGGVFHLIIATIYLIDYFRRDSIVSLVLAKSTAVVFLVVLTLLGERWLVLLSAVIDAAMLVTVLWVRARSGPRGAARRP
jgi:hypothetical protein